MNKTAFGERMVSAGYSKHPYDPFATKTYNFLKNLRDNPNQEIQIIAGEPDFICNVCPDEKKSTCNGIDENHHLYDTAYWQPFMSAESKDKKCANNLGFELGKSSVKQIIKATGTNKKRQSS